MYKEPEEEGKVKRIDRSDTIPESQSVATNWIGNAACCATNNKGIGKILKMKHAHHTCGRFIRSIIAPFNLGTKIKRTKVVVT